MNIIVFLLAFVGTFIIIIASGEPLMIFPIGILVLAGYLAEHLDKGEVSDSRRIKAFSGAKRKGA